MQCLHCFKEKAPFGKTERLFFAYMGGKENDTGGHPQTIFWI